MTFRVEKYAGLLSVAEIGLGSLLHSLSIPFGGHFLSLNQGVVLLFVARGSANRREAVSEASAVSTLAAFAKAFSPAGKKLTPMLAISTQGILFSSGIALGGRNLFGAVLGMTLLSLWAFIQPLLVAYLLFGHALFHAVARLWSSLSLPSEAAYGVLGAILGAKLVVAWAISVFVWRGAPDAEERYCASVERWREKLPQPMKTSGVTPLRGALKDLTTAWFLISLAVTVGFFFWSGERNATAVWTFILRPIACGFIFFYLIRAIPRLRQPFTTTIWRSR